MEQFLNRYPSTQIQTFLLLQARGCLKKSTVLLQARGCLIKSPALLQARGCLIKSSALLQARGCLIKSPALLQARGCLIKSSALLQARECLTFILWYELFSLLKILLWLWNVEHFVPVEMPWFVGKWDLPFSGWTWDVL